MEDDGEKGGALPADRATAVEPVPVSPLRDGIPSADPYADMACDVCRRAGVVGVASSSMGAVSWAFCRECLDNLAEPECMFEHTFECCGDEVADWVRSMSTWRNGSYVTWAEYVAAQGTEAGTAETVGLGPKDDGPVAESDAPEQPQGTNHE